MESLRIAVREFGERVLDAATSPDTFLLVWGGLLLLGIAIPLFFREVICWYFKLNRMDARMSRIEETLDEMRETLEDVLAEDDDDPTDRDLPTDF